MDNRITIIINDTPYGTERPYNALRLANSLIKEVSVTVFLMGDSVVCAKAGQKTRTVITILNGCLNLSGAARSYSAGHAWTQEG